MVGRPALSAVAVTALVAALAVSAPALAGEEPAPEPPETTLFYRDVLAVRVNPLGLINDLRVSGRKRILAPSSALTKETFFGVGTTFVVSPAFVRAGPFIEVQPLSVLTLAAGYEAQGFFGSFDQLQSFPTADVAYDDDTLGVNGDANRQYPTWVRIGFLEARLQGKVGPVVARSALLARHTTAEAKAGDVAYYDQILDILVPTNGWVVTNDADVLYLATDHWIAGARHTFTHSFLREPALAPETHRLGPLVAYRFHDKPHSMFNQPTVNLLAQWWLLHPYRTGRNQPTALPLIALAFSFNGDLF